MKNVGIASKTCRWMITLFLPITLLLMILQAYAFNANFYLDRFQEYNIPTITRINMADLETITVRIIDYLKNNEEDLDMQATVNGKVEEVFGQREKQHMEDVKALFEKGFILKNTSIFLTIGAFLILLKQKKKQEILKSFYYASITSLTVMLLLLILMQIDFFKYFTYFHEIFFANDLWLLNPETDVLIQMLPLEFFIAISTRVVIWFLILMTLIGSISFRKYSRT